MAMIQGSSSVPPPVASAKSRLKPKRPRPARREAFGILNPRGDVWTYDTFHTEADAYAYVERFWRDFSPGAGGDLRRFKVIPVRVTVSALPSKNP